MSVRGFNTGSGIEQYDYDYLDNKPAVPTKESIGLGNVDNTSDMDKPVSTAQANALSQKVDKVPGMGLSSEDFTSADKEKLESLPTNSELEADLEGKANQTEVTSLNQAITDLDGQVNDSTTGLDTKAPAIVNTASGAIASFSDGADSMPVKKLVVAVEPQQDLHGYDNPWPGGGGKNQYNGADIIFNADESATTLNGITLTKNSDGSFTVVGTATAETRLNTRAAYDFKAGKSYTISVRGLTDGNIRIIINGNVSGGGLDYTSEYPTSDFSRTYTITADCGFAYFFIDVQNGATVNNTIRVQIEEGQLTSYSPYSNICPISGWTGAEINDSGVNLIDDTLTNTTNEVLLTEEVWYAQSFVTGSSEINTRLQYFNGSDWIDIVTTPFSTDNFTLVSISGHTNPFGWTYGNQIFSIRIVNPTKFRFSTRSMNRTRRLSISPTQLSAFVEYAGSKEISVTFPSSAGTVYGGTLTINPDRTGQLTVDYVKQDMITLGYSVQYNMCTKTLELTAVASAYGVPNPYVISNRFKTISQQAVLGNVQSGVSISTDGRQIQCYIEGLTGASEYSQYMAENETHVVYKLAAPITYTLTESEISGILETLYGTNNIWADCGDSTVEYTADTKLFIEQLTQPAEDDMTADHAITSGTFFMIGNTLYLATSQIAAGATITPGTNATKLSLADALNQLNA